MTEIVSFNTDLANNIVALVASGHSIPTAASKLSTEDLPLQQDTVWQWYATNQNFRGLLAEALETARICLLLEIKEIADDDSDDVLHDHNDNPIPNKAKLDRDKLRIQARSIILKELAAPAPTAPSDNPQSPSINAEDYSMDQSKGEVTFKPEPDDSNMRTATIEDLESEVSRRG